MLNKLPLSMRRKLQTVVVIVACSCVLEAAAPTGWYVAGSRPTEYESGLDSQVEYNGHPSAYLKSRHPVVEGFGTLMQDIGASHYLGKRVRLSAFVKTEGVEDWAGLWMRVDKGPTQVEFDNMQDRPVKGTTTWKNYEVVLDVPEDATGIFFGVLLGRSGTVWLNSAKFEIVSSDIPTTSRGLAQRRDEPTNLNFEDR